MRRRRGNLMIAPCSCHRPRSQRWKVVRVNDVVGQSRMIWVLYEQIFKNFPGLELPGISLIGRVGGCGEGQRVEDGSFDVVGISSTHSSHRSFVGQDTRTLIRIRGVGKEMCDGINVGTLSLSLRSSGARLLNGFESLIQLRLELKTSGKGVAPIAQCDTPIGDCTRRVACEDDIEGFNGARKLKRVHQGHSTIELRLNRATARSAEVHLAQILRGSVVVSLGKNQPPWQEGTKHKQQSAANLHSGSFSSN